MPIHPIFPVYDEHSRILILGSFPSVRSREVGFFYGHPRNRFWPLLAALFQESIPDSTEEKIDFLLTHHIALWDVVASCDIHGSADSTLKNAIPNDLSVILRIANIRQIFVNGKTAAHYYSRLIEPITGMSAITLPSTSPANASCHFDELMVKWHIILDKCI